MNLSPSCIKQLPHVSLILLSILLLTPRPTNSQGQGGGNPLAGLGIGGLPIPNLGQLFGGQGGGGGPLGGLGLGIPGNQRAGNGQLNAQPQQGLSQLAAPLLSRLRGTDRPVAS